MKNSNFVSFEAVDLQSGFWQDRYNLNKTVSMQNVRLRFEESGRFDALRFNFLKTGKEPHIFYDSDVAKWMEAVAYLIAKDPDSMREHEALCEELIDCMEKAQRPDGYLNSQHQQISPKLIFRDRNRHELYCAGHLIEAAIAYHKATGKDRFLKIMERYCDCIERVFLVEDSASFITPGHEEIELALIKLYRHTKKEKYLKMASYFLEKRGNNAKDSFIYEGNPYGGQDDVSIRNLKDANGHCVRAVYFYSGIADLAAETDDRQLFDNLEKVFEDITERKMYITGGIGSTRESESFTVPYDLPNHTAYTESCCAIALMMFTSRMREISKQAKYGHLAERVLYNSMLSSTSLDGKAFFYENPLEIALEEKDREVAAPVAKRERLPITQRVEVFGCSCCPPNINRFFAHLGDYVCVEDADGLCVEQYISSDLQTAYGAISIREQYALDGKATVCGKGYAAKKISVRIPEWSRNVNATLNGNPVTPEICDGYAYFSVDADFTLDLDFGIALRLLASNPNVRANVGRVALTYGPVVYCLEKADNGAHLNQIAVDPGDLAKAELKADFHKLYSVCMPAYRLQEKTSLYYDDGDNVYTPITAKWIPYFAFANRGESDMLVWVRKLVK
jgi:DUF1680 family protein